MHGYEASEYEDGLEGSLNMTHNLKHTFRLGPKADCRFAFWVFSHGNDSIGI